MERFGSPYWMVARIAVYSELGRGRNGRLCHQPGAASRTDCTIAVGHRLGRRRTAANNRICCYFGSFGNPRTISPTMFFWICDEPA